MNGVRGDQQGKAFWAPLLRAALKGWPLYMPPGRAGRQSGGEVYVLCLTIRRQRTDEARPRSTMSSRAFFTTARPVAARSTAPRSRSSCRAVAGERARVPTMLLSSRSAIPRWLGPSLPPMLCSAALGPPAAGAAGRWASAGAGGGRGGGSLGARSGRNRSDFHASAAARHRPQPL